LIVPSLAVTVPAPATDFVTVKLYAVVAKVAVTAFAASIVTVQAPVPEHPPDQPEKVDPLLADAAKVTDVPELKLSVQVDPQLIPEGTLVTIPAPVPDFVTVKLYTTDVT